MDKPIHITVLSVCGESPYHFAKNEALRLLERIPKDAAADLAREPLILDFAEVVGISSSGAQVLVTGLARRYGRWPEQNLLFVNVAENLMPSLEDAVANLQDVTGVLRP